MIPNFPDGLSDHVVAENQFSSLAIQAGLHKKYRTVISTDILSLREGLAC